MLDTTHALTSSLSDEALASLLQDLPAETPIPTYPDLTYPDFLKNHLLPNTPFILSAQSTSSWPSRSLWSIPNTTGPSRPNVASLRQYGNHHVPVADTHRREYSEFARSVRPLGDVLDEWEEGGGAGLYVKDWHLLAELEKDGKGVGEVYTVPECFREDWLNPSYMPHPRNPLPNLSNPRPDNVNPNQSDFRFTYLGPAGTFTPLHRDVYASYSWSANIVGRKIWWLFPPDQLDSLGLGPGKEGGGGSAGGMVFDVREVKGDVGGMKVVQEEGEIIFVPSGWYHQVLNLDFCISINHNFIAPLTLPRVYTALQENQAKVEESISDVKSMIRSRYPPNSKKSETDPDISPSSDKPNIGGEVEEWEREWVEEVQKLLEMDAGWDWSGFWNCVRQNVESPPAGPKLSTPITMRNEVISSVIDRYKVTREWAVLNDVRRTVQDIADLI